MLIIFNIIFVLCLFSSSFGEEPYALEKIVVRQDKGHSPETFTASDIKERNPGSLADLLDSIGGLELRYRGPLGVQGDLSLNGSTAEQVAVLIDGLNVTDPQTGHHNLDIPLTIFDVEKIEVFKEGSSSSCGAGAFAGSVNIVTKKPTRKVLNLDTLFGEHALFGQLFSFSLSQEDFSGRLSFEHKVSSGARANTDFEYKTISLYLNKDFSSVALDGLFGFQKKDFGADSFYSNLFPEEEEHTETVFIRTGLNSDLSLGSFKNNLFFRKHRDKFILQRNNPFSVNYHTTYVYGVKPELSLPIKYGDILLGVDTGRDEIYSSNLGKHTRLHEACFIGFIPERQGKLDTNSRLRLDHYQGWSSQASYNFGLDYGLIDNKLKITSSVSRAFRIPSFTELYYSDAANKGNPELKVETSDNFRLGLDFKEENIFLGIDGFLRRGKNLIDWTRASAADPWRATNLGRVDFCGIGFSSKLNPDLQFKGLELEKVAFSYNYMDVDKKTSGSLSKYALDILKHQFILDIYSTVFGLNFSWQLSYNQRYYGEIYFVGNLYMAKKIITKDFILEPFIKIDNFSNTEYSEIAAVLQPGRWVKAGLKFEW